MSFSERERVLGDRRDDDLFTIYVNNLPDELNQDGIAQIFKSYGQICSLFAPPNANWAYVSYKTYKEAEHAIRALNERSPLYLNVAFRKKKVQLNKQQNGPTEDRTPVEHVENAYLRKELSHLPPDTRKIMPELLAMNVAKLSNTSVDNSVYPTDLDNNLYDPFENVGHYADTNAMWSRGCMVIDENGKRFVSQGRGYTKYYIPEPAYPQIEKQIGRVYENRQAGFYQYGLDNLSQEIDKCLYCGRLAELRCADCSSHYCSRDCQVADWPCHRKNCKTMPSLVGSFDETALSSCINKKPIHFSRKPRAFSNLGLLDSLRRPRNSSNVENLRNSIDGKTPMKEDSIHGLSRQLQFFGTSEKNDNSVLINNHTSPIVPRTETRDVNGKENDESILLENDEKNMQRNCSTSVITDEKSKIELLKSSPIISKSDYLKMEKGLAFQREKKEERNCSDIDRKKDTSSFELPSEKKEIVRNPVTRKILTFLSKEKFVQVRIVLILPDTTFWVNKMEDVEKIETMMAKLNEKAENYEKIDKPVVGEIYAVLYENIWHRAEVLTEKPLRILYIDFGNDEPPQSHDFRSLKDFEEFPAFGIHVRLPTNSNIKNISVDEEISLKMIGIDESGIAEVAILEKTISQPEIVSQPEVEEKKTESLKISEKVSKKLSNTIDNLKIGNEGFIEVYLALNNNSYAVCVLTNDFMIEYQMIYEKLTETCEGLTKIENIDPKIGDFICGKRDDIWVRGYVFSLGPPIRLALVDEARISTVEKILPMPKNYENICSFGSILEIENTSANKLQVGENGHFRVIESSQESGDKIIKCVFLAPDHLKDVQFSIKNWNPTPEQKGVKFAELKNNSEVCITAYRSEKIMFVQSLDTASLERSQRTLQNVAKWAQKAPKLKEIPVIGELVIAKFIDGNYYRAIVTKIEGDKINVSYVDYGNSEVTTMDQLRILSDDLKEQGSCVCKVVLKDIKTDVAPTKEVHQYLDTLVGTEQPFICSFDGIPSKDGVTLTTATGECVNKKVNDFLTPAWQREDLKNMDCFMIDQLETANLGEIGHTIKALTLYATDPPTKYVLAPFDKEHITHVTGIMPELMQKYCDSTKVHYIPRTGELCLAVWEGCWYRGACIDHKATPYQALIYFVDFGNEALVDFTNIRQMTEDFMFPPGLGLSCVVKNLGIQLVNGKVPEKVLQRMEKLVPLNELIDVKIIRKASANDKVPLDGDYEIELPTVREILVAEGLAK